MNRWLSTLLYGILACGLIFVDRITKMYALASCVEPCTINRFVSLECIFNRGISWGILSSDQNIIHLGISLLITAIIIIMLVYTYRSWRRGNVIIGEILVLAGALSNLIDRIVYHYVIDFIHLSYQGWSWPNFNVADMSICVGVFLMLLTIVREK